MDDAPLFPVMLNLRGWRVLVVGGGTVGRRKAKLAGDAGASVTVVDPALPGGRSFEVSQLEGIQLAFACATAEVNECVVEACRSRGIPVCDAIVPERGSFILPSVVRRGDLQIAISTGGASPALARRIRQELESAYDESYGEWVALLGEIRREILLSVPDIAMRKKLFEEFAGAQWLERLRRDGAEVVMIAMRRMVHS